MSKYKRHPDCQNCDEDGYIESDCTASFVAVRYKCDCLNTLSRELDSYMMILLEVLESNKESKTHLELGRRVENILERYAPTFERIKEIDQLKTEQPE